MGINLWITLPESISWKRSGQENRRFRYGLGNIFYAISRDRRSGLWRCGINLVCVDDSRKLADVYESGRAGWKSIIPVYNTYTAYKIALDSEYVLDLFHIYSVGKYIFQYFRRRFLVVFGISGRSVRTGNDRFVCVLLCESGEKLRKRTWVYDRTDFP